MSAPRRTARSRRGARAPLHESIYQRLRDGILDGTRGPDDRLPSTRALAAELGVARGTVEDVYRRLRGEGYVSARGADGTRVRALGSGPRSGRGEGHVVASPERRGPYGAPRGRALGVGMPALAAFPFEAWATAVGRAARAMRRVDLAHADPEGDPALRAALARHIALSRGVDCRPAQVFVTSGFQASLGLVVRALLDATDRVAVEDPGYPRARDALAYLGVALEPVPVDAEGMRPAAPGAKLALVTPSHQMPDGVALSLPRRLALLGWARRGRGWVLEDDYDGEFHFGGRPPPALASIDRLGRVVYAGTLSKAMFPGLRLGFVVAPDEARPRLAEACSLLAPAPSTVVQRALADFMDRGQFGRHLGRMRTLYGRRRQAVVDALTEQLGGRVVVEAEARGLHLLVTWHHGPTDAAVARKAAERGLGVRARSDYAVTHRAVQRGLLVGFANVPERSAVAAVASLREAFEALGSGRGERAERGPVEPRPTPA